MNVVDERFDERAADVLPTRCLALAQHT
jgi:hypothetical protein